ncbi:hypothetical protein [Chryseobacterium chendengshani]|uniref:hypothetical protein n=1 Tax=Chryseobacterium sp. LJ756 TaxID=2864113 RepID=UPI001C63BCEC|nr:hypothetical protein [Chryseobacterium sp. LJ756]MBW7675939.1 hypothetical protein [Chryseobacterium sp. LJ756]
MKKNNFLMLLACLLLFFGCRQELDVVNQEDQTSKYNLTKDNVKTKILKKADYENINFLKADVNQISGFLKTQKYENSASSKSTQIISGYEIYTDTFEEVSYLNAKYHSFYIIGQENAEYEEKLVLKSIDNQIIEKYILRYKRKLNFSIDPNSYQTIKLSDSQNTNGKMMFIDTFSMGCSTYTVTSYECGYTGHHTNGQYCSVLNASMPFNTVSVSFDPNCMASEGGGSSGGGGGGGGGGVPGSYTPPVISIPTSAPLYVIHGPKGTTCNSLGLDASEVDQINSDQSLRLKIYQYIAVSGSTYPLPCDNDFFTEEYKTFIKAIIKYVSESGTPANDLTFDYLNSAYQFFQNEYYDMTEPENFFHRLKALDNALVQNQNLLLDIPCSQLPYWQDVATHQVPQSVKTKMQNIKNQTSYYDNWLLTDLDDGLGTKLNMDLFPVKITTMPNKPNSTQKYTPAEFFEFFRKNINLFAEQFTPISDSVYGIDDTVLWNSSNPLGALIHIDIDLIPLILSDDGTVVCTGYWTNSWMFTTVKAPLDPDHDGIHPVAGNRLFSYFTNPDGSINIYTRGVDRVSRNYSNNSTILNSLIQGGAFAGADKLWTDMQDKLKNYIDTNGGSASKVTPVKYRPDYTKIVNYIKGNATISTLGCH